MEKDSNSILFLMVEFISEVPVKPEVFGRNIDMEDSSFFLFVISSIKPR